MEWKQRIRLELSRTGTGPDEEILDELAQHARAMYDTARADGASREEAEHRVDLQIAVWAAARLQLPTFAFTPERRTALVAAVVERLQALPSVTFVTHSNSAPLGISGGSAFTMDARQVQASSRDVDPGYFAAMGMRIASGRDFSEEDVASERPVFVVNRSFARQYLSDNAVGQHVQVSFRQGPSQPWEIIAVVDDVLHRGVTEPAEPEIDAQTVAEQLVAQAEARGIEPVGPNGLLSQLTKRVFGTALEAE